MTKLINIILDTPDPNNKYAIYLLQVKYILIEDKINIGLLVIHINLQNESIKNIIVDTINTSSKNDDFLNTLSYEIVLKNVIKYEYILSIIDKLEYSMNTHNYVIDYLVYQNNKYISLQFDNQQFFDICNFINLFKINYNEIYTSLKPSNNINQQDQISIVDDVNIFNFLNNNIKLLIFNSIKNRELSYEIKNNELYIGSIIDYNLYNLNTGLVYNIISLIEVLEIDNNITESLMRQFNIILTNNDVKNNSKLSIIIFILFLILIKSNNYSSYLIDDFKNQYKYLHNIIFQKIKTKYNLDSINKLNVEYNMDMDMTESIKDKLNIEYLKFLNFEKYYNDINGFKISNIKNDLPFTTTSYIDFSKYDLQIQNMIRYHQVLNETIYPELIITDNNLLSDLSYITSNIILKHCIEISNNDLLFMLYNNIVPFLLKNKNINIFKTIF